MTAFPLIERVRRLAEKARGTTNGPEHDKCSDQIVAAVPALADVAEQALKALTKIADGMIHAYPVRTQCL